MASNSFSDKKSCKMLSLKCGDVSRNASPGLRQAQIVALLMIIVCPTAKQIIN
jgi:hypothetical protein